MATMRVAPERLPTVMTEADRIADLLLRKRVDLNEAKKAIQFYAYSGANRELFDQYLSRMADDPPPRSRRTREYYRALLTIWRETGRVLSEEEKGYAWFWTVRLAQAASKTRT